MTKNFFQKNIVNINIKIINSVGALGVIWNGVFASKEFN